MVTIHGPASLSGTVPIQGAKNAAMKYAVLPLLTNNKFTFTNIPHITSITNLLDISAQQGAQINWLTDNTFSIDTTSITSPHRLNAESFYFTSGGIFYLTILTSRFGQILLEKHTTRTDTGGDAIGSRSLDLVRQTLTQLGINSADTDTDIKFTLASTDPFDFTVPKTSFGVTINAIIAAIFKQGQSIIRLPSREAEADDIVNFLIAAGADIQLQGDAYYVNGPSHLKGITYNCISDKNDFATWCLISVATHSRLVLTNVDLPQLKTEKLLEILDNWGVLFNYENGSFTIDSSHAHITPQEINSGNYPLFHTDWQPLIAPILSQASGTSTIIDNVFDNRMGHCLELAKMGFNFDYFDPPSFPAIEDKHRGVRLRGPIPLQQAAVTGFDVRGTAALIIAALMAQGDTQISGIEHLDRGYENFFERLAKIGATLYS